ncbi:MAG: dockerin type I domain-containing protein [Candidatus Bathyarchaeia archaeon]
MGRKVVLTLVVVVLLLLMPMVAVVTQIASAQKPKLKVGVIVPYRLPQGDAYTGGAEGGAMLAAIDINAAGGIDINGTLYEIELVKDPATNKFYDEYAYNPFDPDSAYDSAWALCEAGCKFIIGGFRTECTWEIMRAIAHWNKEYASSPEDWVIYLINGASTDDLCKESECINKIGSEYAPFDWRFRINPINSTMLFYNVLGWMKGYLLPKKLIPMWKNVKVACIAEDLEWTDGICNYFRYVGLGPNTTVVQCIETPPGTTDFDEYLTNLKDLGVNLLCHFYTLIDSKYLVMDWYEGQYPFVLCGIDVQGQSGWWPSNLFTAGKCEYEMTEDFAGTRTPITPMATKFWDHFVGNFSLSGYPQAWPIYTAWGAYNAFLVIKNALETADTLNSTRIIEVMEQQEIWVLNGKAKFTSSHDVYTDEWGPTWKNKYTRAMFAQWIKEKNVLIKQVVCPIDQEYSRKAAIPLWIHPLGDVDLNFDGKVDMKDVAMVSKAFGSYPGQPEWDIECDVNYDGKVDMKDVAMVSKKFGQYVQPWPP